MSAEDWFANYWWMIIPLVLAGICFAVAEKTHNVETDAKCRKWCRRFIIFFLLWLAYAVGVWRGSHNIAQPQGNPWELSQVQNQ